MHINEYNKQRITANKQSLCHAPGYSMHFSKNGLVSACSYTRFMPLGRYPDQSLDEIWFGEEAERIRAEMRTDHFPAGCIVCSADADAGNYGQMRSVLYEQYARTPIDRFMTRAKNKLRTGRAAEYPRVLSFELSNTCNLECVMCLGLLSSSIRQNREKLPPLPQLYGKEFLPQLRPFIPHLQEAKFFGGEPFLIDLYLDIWELFIELNPACKIYITTNGTILNNRVKNILAKLPNFQMVVSLDAITQPTYEKIRINANFQRVMEHVKYFSEISQQHGRRLIISPTYMTHNCEEYPDILDFANRENILFETNILTTPHELSMVNLPPQKLEEVLKLWTEHVPHAPEDPELGRQNQKEFEKARRQVEFMLKEQQAFYSDRLGRKLATFAPANKMEDCLLIILRHSMRTTRDPSLPLRLIRLWKEEGPMLANLCDATTQLALYLDENNNADAIRKLQLELRLECNETYTVVEQMEIIQALFANEKKTCTFILAMMEADQATCREVIREAAAGKQKVKQLAEEDLF